MKEEFDIEDLYRDEFGQDQLTPPSGGFKATQSKHLLKKLKMFGGMGLLSAAAIVGVYQIATTDSIGDVDGQKEIVQESKSKSHVLGAVQSQSSNGSEGSIAAAFPEQNSSEQRKHGDEVLKQNEIAVADINNDGAVVSMNDLNNSNDDSKNNIDEVTTGQTVRKPKSTKNSDPSRKGSEFSVDDQKILEKNKIYDAEQQLDVVGSSPKKSEVKDQGNESSSNVAPTQNEKADQRAKDNSRQHDVITKIEATTDQIQNLSAENGLNDRGNILEKNNGDVSKQETEQSTVAEALPKGKSEEVKESKTELISNASQESSVVQKKTKVTTGAETLDGQDKHQDVLALDDRNAIKELNEEQGQDFEQENDKEATEENVEENKEMNAAETSQPDALTAASPFSSDKKKRSFKIRIHANYGRSFIKETPVRSVYSSIDEFGFALKKPVFRGMFQLSSGLSFTTQRHELGINNDAFITIDEEDPLLWYNDHVEYFSLVKRHLELPISLQYHTLPRGNWMLDLGAGLKYSRVIDAYEDIDYTPFLLAELSEEPEELTFLEEHEHVVGEAKQNFFSAHIFAEIHRIFKNKTSFFTRLKYRMPFAEMYDADAGLAWDYDFSSNALMLGVGVEF